MQFPGSNGVFIRGIRLESSCGSFFFVAEEGEVLLPFLGSTGFSACSGMAQEPPNRSAPGIRPWAQYWWMRRCSTPHFAPFLEWINSLPCDTSLPKPSVPIHDTPVFSILHDDNLKYGLIRADVLSRQITRSFPRERTQVSGLMLREVRQMENCA